MLYNHMVKGPPVTKKIVSPTIDKHFQQNLREHLTNKQRHLEMCKGKHVELEKR